MNDLELIPKGYILVTAHRQESVDAKERFEGIIKVLEVVAKEFGLPVACFDGFWWSSGRELHFRSSLRHTFEITPKGLRLWRWVQMCWQARSQRGYSKG